MIKKLLSTVLTLALVVTALPWNAQAAAYKIASEAVVLMDAATGEVLFSRNRNKKLYPASITKIMTGLLAVEHTGSTDLLTASSTAVNIPKGYAHIGLQEWDTITVKDAMYSMMLPSANDAANVLAEHVAGSQKQFTTLMNARARELGATNTNFANANGMPLKNHYTTAYDMALITREAIRNKSFFQYFSAREYTLPAVNNSTKEVELQSYQFMMRSDKDEYHPDVTAGKIGYTAQAGHTMATVATRNGRTLIVVVLGSNRDGKYEDTKQLLSYGFKQ